MIRFLYRTFKFALQHFWRNIWLSLATVTVVTLTLFAVHLVWLFQAMGNQALVVLQNKIDVSVYLQTTVTTEEQATLVDGLRAIPQVKEARVVTPEEALQNFRERHRADTALLQSLDELGENPFGATVVVRAEAADDYPVILALLEQSQYKRLIEDKTLADNAKLVARIAQLSRQARQVGLLFAAIFGGVAVLVVFNSVRVAIYTHHDEIAIMKLVGATNSFVRMPFFYEEIFYGLLAAAVATAIFYAVLTAGSQYLGNFFGGQVDFVGLFLQSLPRLAALQAGVAVGICVVSGSIAVGRHLKV